MEISDLVDRVSDLIAHLETEKIRDLILDMDHQSFMILGAATAFLVILCLLKKMVRTATLIVALCATTVLLHFSIPEPGHNISLSQIVALFVGGTGILASSVYLIFIRAD